MKYELRISATCGDVVALIYVAHAMAKAASTAYGKAPLHKPTFNGRLPMYVKLLLNESRAGRLRVCNQFEHQGTAEELISAAESSGDLTVISRYLMEPDWEKVHRENPPISPGAGAWVLKGIDLGPTEVDWDSTYLGCLCAKLHHLNEWGRANGDEFVINSDAVEWLDERGVMTATAVINKTESHPTIRTDANTTPAQSPATTEAVVTADASGGVEPDKTGPDDKKPWLVADPTDPTAPHHWYTPARYFARQLVRSDSTLLIKKPVLADKVSKSLFNAGICKRGGKKPYDAATVLKAFSNVPLG